MSAPSLMFTNEFCPPVSLKKMPEATATKLFIGLVVADTVFSLTSLIVGILGALSVIGMPPAAAYALIGVSALITLPWLAFATLMIIGVAGDKCEQAKKQQSKIK